MTGKSEFVKTKLSRRSLLKGVPILTGAVVAAAALPKAALAKAKLSHSASQYQDSPKNGQKCSGCSQFQPPSSCKIVQDPISPNGWCKFYQPKGK
ncbi:MAG TPA: high potential iron sulfur protein [Pararhizobium sp.]|nr:high potential iron sulfur protein [Pararhizobium sp.]